MNSNIEQTALQAMQYFARTLKPKNQGWNILEINQNGVKEYFNMFGEGNTYKSLSGLNMGGVDYFIPRPDLSSIPEVEDQSCDLVIHTLTLQQTWDFKESLRECYRVLKPGGFLLINVPWVCENRGENDYWRISHHALGRILEEVGFDHGRVALWNDNLTAGIARRPNDSKS